MKASMPRLMRRLAFPALLVLAVFIAFGGSLVNSYGFDDVLVTTPENKLVSRGLDGAGDILTKQYSVANGQQYGYRPVTLLLFAAEYDAFGLNPAVSHFINLLLYAVLVLLVYALLLRLFPDYDGIQWFWAAMLFALHPLHTEVALSLKNREEILVALFGFGALWTAMNFAEKRGLHWLILSAALMLLGFFTKVSIYPFWLFIGLVIWRVARADLNTSATVFFTHMAMGVIYTLMVSYVLGISVQNREMDFIENPFTDTAALNRIWLGLSTFGWYVKMLFWPWPLSVYYGLGGAPVADSIGIYMLIGALATVAFGLIFWRSFQRNGPHFTAICAVLVFLVPYLNVAWMAPGVVAERFAFVPVLGFTIGVVLLLGRYAPRPTRWLLGVALLMLAADMARTPQWIDVYTTVSTDAKKSGSVKLLNMKAELLHNQLNTADGNDKLRLVNEASEAYRQAVLSYPENAGAYQNWGVLMATTGQPEKGEKLLLRAIEFGRTDADVFYNLGAVMEMQGRAFDALHQYHKALKLNPSHVGSAERIAFINGQPSR